MLASNFKKQKKEKYYTYKETYNVKSKRAKNWICTWESHQSALGWNQFLRLHIMIFLLKSILIFLPLRFHGIFHTFEFKTKIKLIWLEKYGQV